MTDDDSEDLDARLDDEIEAYVADVREALRRLGTDPGCLRDIELFGLMVEAHEVGGSPAEAAAEIAAAVRARDAADAKPSDDGAFWRTLRDCAQG